MGGGQDVVDGQIDIGRAVDAVFRRHGVQAEIGGADADCGLAPDAAGDAQHLQLGLAVEAVA